MGTALILLLLGFGALAAGILIGRYYVPDDRMLKRTARHAKQYMLAMTDLLSRDREGAIARLRSVVEENIDDVEPYFALASLFRSRGEWERAIRVHQALHLREGSSKKLRLRARYELGLDFRSAGMPRRATRAMEDCLAQEPKHEGALLALCGLYEEQGRYAEAADAWRRLHKLRGEERPVREHHLLVAAAQRALAGGDVDSARRLLRDAEKMDDHSVHMLAVAAEVAAARDNPKGASARLRQALAVAPELAAFLVPGLVEAQRQLVIAELDKQKVAGEGRAAREDELTFQRAAAEIATVLADIPPDPHLLLAQADLRSHFDPVAAVEDYRDIVRRFPDLLPARVAGARLALAGGDQEEIEHELRALVGAKGALAWAADGVWRCGHCGQRGDEFFWRCDECRRWGTIRLDIGRDAIEPIPHAPPRERRELPRGGPSQALLGSIDAALPEPALDHGLADDELRAAGQRRSVLGRVGGFFTGAFRRKKPKQLPAADREDR